MSEEIKKEVVRLFKVHKTLHEMVVDRGFSVSETETRRSLLDFKNEYFPGDDLDYARMNFVVAHTTDDSRQLLVYFADQESVGVQPIRKLCERLAQGGINEAIIIYKKSITSSAQKVIQTLSSNYHIESFQIADLLVNITKHELVPKHVVMSVEDKKTLLQRYRLKETQLPRILLHDPVAKYFGLKRGQVVKIIRNSETAGRYVTYRLCW